MSSPSLVLGDLCHVSYGVFIAAWLAAAGVLVSRGFGGRVLWAVLFLVVVLVLTGITFRVTTPFERPSTASRAGLWFQLGIVVVFGTMEFLILWADLGPWAWSADVPRKWLFGVLLPAGALFLMGASRNEIGFGRGQFAWKVLAIWGAPLATAVAVGVMGGLIPSALIAREAGRQVFQVFPEEVLYRACLQSRLAGLIGSPWAIVATGSLFGLRHTLLMTGATGGDAVAGAASAFLQQGVLGGVGLSIVFARTGNVFVPFALHLLGNFALFWL